MLTRETIESCEKENLPTLAFTLEKADIEALVGWLIEKDDNFRYKCFLLLQCRSEQQPDVYPFWDVFVEKLKSDNSYQRSLGLMLIAENARWDQAGKFETVIETYLSLCDDEKPVTVRQCIQGLGKIVPCKPPCHARIIEKLTAIDLMQRKETQRKLLLLDILSTLILIQKHQPDPQIERYLHNALTGGILDLKAKKQIMDML
ncbi:MAG TPA: hypothetical protein PKW33_15930 [Anaerolineaceae bacterium]|nr:hypothetical protein [Anaerolineaceae bacterium]HPN53086.1 hypothetical protein [Anaerolineaceae bacterium]